MTDETTPPEPGTEEQIFDAARDVFYRQGFDGARMQEIAKGAGINHSMLHYYYRTKGKLFDAVFRKAVLELMPPVVDVLRSDLPLLEKLETFVDQYVQTISANPHLPAFIIQELRRNPDALIQVAETATSGVMDVLRAEVSVAVYRREIRSTSAEHLIANVLAMCIFPFAARPMLQTLLGSTDEVYEHFLTERADEIKRFIRIALLP